MESKKIKTHDEPGRGRKLCPQCKKYLGARMGVCVCGHKFEKSTKKKKEKIPQPTPVKNVTRIKNGETVTYNPRQIILTTPAGLCPYKLEETDRDSVNEWAEKIRVKGHVSSRLYTVNALIFYLNQFFKRNSEEHKLAKCHLQEIYAKEYATLNR